MNKKSYYYYKIFRKKKVYDQGLTIVNYILMILFKSKTFLTI